MDLDKLAIDLSKKLPKYARPLFIRKIGEVELTGTYKLKKVQLQKEGFDINHVQDPIFFMGPKDKSYKKLDQSSYLQIMTNAKL